MLRKFSLILPLAALLLLNGCSLNQLTKTQKALENCKFTLQSIEPDINVTMNGFTPVLKVKFNVVLGVENTTDFNLAMNRLDVKLFLDDLELATATTNKYIKIPKGETQTMALTMEIDPDVASKKLVERLQGNELQYKAVATFYFKVLDFNIPVNKTLSKDKI